LAGIRQLLRKCGYRREKSNPVGVRALRPARATHHRWPGFFLVLFTRMAMMRAVRLIAKRPQSARGRASFGAEYRYYARANTFLTDLAYHCPPRGVLMPRALRASAV